MNARRAALLCSQIAAAFTALGEAILEEEHQGAVPKQTTPRRRARHRPMLSEPVNDTDVASARAAARRAGITIP